eukprot:1233475-Rhodomonas_salina.1
MSAGQRPSDQKGARAQKPKRKPDDLRELTSPQPNNARLVAVTSVQQERSTETWVYFLLGPQYHDWYHYLVPVARR